MWNSLSGHALKISWYQSIEWGIVSRSRVSIHYYIALDAENKRCTGLIIDHNGDGEGLGPTNLPTRGVSIIDSAD